MRLKQAFTLVEAIVVVAIIAVISAILFPVFARAKSEAKSASCLSNLHQIGLAMQMYTADANEHYPRCADAVDLFTNQWVGTVDEKEVKAYPLLSTALKPYAGSAAIFICPGDFGTEVRDIGVPSPFKVSPSWGVKYGLSYLWNTQISLSKATTSSVPNPTKVSLVFDGSGSWHSGKRLMTLDDTFTDFTQGLRYNSLFGDLHVKNTDYDTMEVSAFLPVVGALSVLLSRPLQR